jgi:hypothetical protein
MLFSVCRACPALRDVSAVDLDFLRIHLYL